MGRVDVATPAELGGDAVGVALVALVADLIGRASSLDPPATVVAVGLVAPGRVNAVAGVVEYAANLGWRDDPLAEVVSRSLAIEVPVAVDHDARVAGREEALAAGRTDTARSCPWAPVSAAPSSSIRQPEPGNPASRRNGTCPGLSGAEPCACGQRGCLETYASASAIARRYGQGPDRTRESATAEEIVGLLGMDAAADRVWAEALAALAAALASCVLLIDPGAIVLGGGLARAKDTLVELLVARLTAALTWRTPPPVECAILGANAGILGAGRLAWEAAALPASTDHSMGGIQ